MKISGMAASVKRGALLCHGSLLVDSDLSLMWRVLKNMRYPVANLRDLVEDQDLLQDVEGKVVRGFENTFGVKFVETELLKDERDIVQRLVEEESSPRWVSEKV
jgi:lipoate-protein ligase A